MRTIETHAEESRLEAAEEVCWTLMLMMGFGGLEDVPMEWRDMLAKPLQEWCDFAVKTGEMKDG